MKGTVELNYVRTCLFGENFVIGVITLNVNRKKFPPLGLARLEWEMSSLVIRCHDRC